MQLTVTHTRIRRVATQVEIWLLEPARRILAANPDTGLRELTRQIAMVTRYRISESTAAKLRDEVRAQSQDDMHNADAGN